VRYQVPDTWRDFWSTAMDIAFSTQLSNPAWTYRDGKGFHIRFSLGWANAGTLAYEAAHVSWDLNTNAQKTAYKEAFDRLVKTEPFMVLLFQQKPHELVADEDTTHDVRIGGHAETYRCLGDKTPKELKQYYPRLF
jgi:hypothetical protein